MKFLVISDIHDNLVNLEKCLNWGRAREINDAICCGDVVNAETLANLAENFNIIYLVRGNLEIYDEVEINKYNNKMFVPFKLQGFVALPQLFKFLELLFFFIKPYLLSP